MATPELAFAHARVATTHKPFTATPRRRTTETGGTCRHKGTDTGTGDSQAHDCTTTATTSAKGQTVTKNCADNGHHTCHQRRRGIQPLHRWLCTVYSHARCRFPGHEARRTRRTTPFSREETILPQIRPWQVATHRSHVRVVTRQVDATTPTPRQSYRAPLYLAADESGGEHNVSTPQVLAREGGGSSHSTHRQIRSPSVEG